MKEVGVQSRLIKAIEAHGGVATKLSNRFLKGVSDLLIKLPDYPMGLFEVKFDTRPVCSDSYCPKVTQLQDEFLRKYDAAGAPTGVISFLHGPTKNYQIKDWWVVVHGKPFVRKIHLIAYLRIERPEDAVRVIKGHIKWELEHGKGT